MPLYQVDLPYACCGIVVEDDRIIQAPPILKRWRGELLPVFLTWVKSQRGAIELVKEEVSHRKEPS